MYARSNIEARAQLGKPGPASIGLKHYAPKFHIKGGALYQINNQVRGKYMIYISNLTSTCGALLKDIRALRERCQCY